MGVKHCVIAFFLLMRASFFAQSAQTDSLSVQPQNKFELNLDLASRYLWRGQSWGGDYAVVQPTIDYHLTDHFSIGFWATTNFESRYFYADQITGPRGYQEVDFNIKYEFTPWLSAELWDYYWPTVSKVEGVNNSFLNYGPDSVKTVDATLIFDLNHWKIPLECTVSTLVAGSDYRYNDAGENPKQNFTTYVEALYSRDFWSEYLSVEAAIGAVLNNQAEYYTAGDYDKVSLVNLSFKATHEWSVTERFTIPLWINYVHNAAGANTEAFGRNFLIAGLSFYYQ
jgi:hypothetical protein